MASLGLPKGIFANYWLKKPDSPKAKLANEKPQGETVDYDRLSGIA